MLENIWFKFVGLLPSVILFILIPLFIVWVAFYFLNPKGTTYSRTIANMLIVGFFTGVLQLLFILFQQDYNSIGLSLIFAMAVFLGGMEKYHKMSTKECFKFVLLFLIASFAVMFSVRAFL